MATQDDGSISIGDILSSSIAVMLRNPAVILGSAFLFGAVPQALLNLVVQTLARQPQGVGRLWGPFLLGGLVMIVLTALSHIMVVRATAADRQGGYAGFGDCLGFALRLFLPLIGLYVLMYLGIVLGMILLIVPGIILALMWTVAGPALVVERCGVFAAFGRSRALTKGHRWTILGLFVLVIVLVWIVSVVVGLVTAGTMSFTSLAAMRMAGQLPIAYTLLSLVTGTLISAFFATLFANLYFALKEAREGPETIVLAEIFA